VETDLGTAALTSSPRAVRRLTRAVAWLSSIFVLVLVGFGLTAIPNGDPISVLDVAAALVAAGCLTLTGAVLLTRLPANPIGWLLSVGGLLFALANSESWLPALLVNHGFMFGVWVFWIAALCWVPAVVCVAVLVPLLFPTGHLVSRRWGLVVFAGLASIVLSTLQDAFTPYPPNSAPTGLSNPVGVSGSLLDLLGIFGAISSLAGVVCLPLVAASLISRYRGAAGIERAQLRWFAAVIAIIGPAFAIGIVTSPSDSPFASTIGNLAFLATFVGLALLPVAIGIAVLRYRLYDIDIIVRRTAVYVPLTAILAGLYAASIALLQRVFIAATGGPSDGAVILSTLILATTFTPIRSWLQGMVDRRFGNAGDAEHLIRKFVDDNANASWALDPTRTMRAFLLVCVRALGAPGGLAYVAADDGERGAGSIGVPSDAGALIVPVEAQGRHLGRLELAPRRDRRPYSERDVALLQRAGAEVAAILVEP